MSVGVCYVVHHGSSDEAGTESGYAKSFTMIVVPQTRAETDKPEFSRLIHWKIFGRD